MATEAEREEVKRLIRFYEKRGWDWSLPAEFLLWKANGGRWVYVYYNPRATGARPRLGRPRKKRK